jgi:hypothetical protein
MIDIVWSSFLFRSRDYLMIAFDVCIFLRFFFVFWAIVSVKISELLRSAPTQVVSRGGDLRNTHLRGRDDNLVGQCIDGTGVSIGHGELVKPAVAQNFVGRGTARGVLGQAPGNQFHCFRRDMFPFMFGETKRAFLNGVEQ